MNILIEYNEYMNYLIGVCIKKQFRNQCPVGITLCYASFNPDLRKNINHWSPEFLPVVNIPIIQAKFVGKTFSAYSSQQTL